MAIASSVGKAAALCFQFLNKRGCYIVMTLRGSVGTDAGRERRALCMWMGPKGKLMCDDPVVMDALVGPCSPPGWILRPQQHR